MSFQSSLTVLVSGQSKTQKTAPGNTQTGVSHCHAIVMKQQTVSPVFPPPPGCLPVKYAHQSDVNNRRCVSLPIAAPPAKPQSRHILTEDSQVILWHVTREAAPHTCFITVQFSDVGLCHLKPGQGDSAPHGSVLMLILPLNSCT